MPIGLAIQVPLENLAQQATVTAKHLMKPLVLAMLMIIILTPVGMQPTMIQMRGLN